jgi:hypothetical protein
MEDLVSLEHIRFSPVSTSIFEVLPMNPTRRPRSRRHLRRKQVIKISFYAHQPPNISLPASLRGRVKLEFTDRMEQQFLFVSHGGVGIYQAYKEEQHGFVEEWAVACFATRRWIYWENPEAFTTDEIPEIPEQLNPRYRKQYPNSEVKQKLAFAIDQGWITQHGLNLPNEAAFR